MNTQTMHNTIDGVEPVQKLERQKNTSVSPFSKGYFNPEAIVPDPNAFIALVKKEGRELTASREFEIWAQESNIFSDNSPDEIRDIIKNSANDYYEYVEYGKSQDKSQSTIMGDLENRIAKFGNMEDMPQILKIANSTVANIYSQLYPNSQQATLDMQRIIKFGVILANNK